MRLFHTPFTLRRDENDRSNLLDKGVSLIGQLSSHYKNFTCLALEEKERRRRMRGAVYALLFGVRR